MGEHRAVFDFRITFTNGGEITGRDFRLDVPGPHVGRSDVGLLLVRHLGLLMVDQVELEPFQIVQEAHRGGRGVAGTVGAGATRQVVDLSHPITHGMVTYPGLPGPQISDHLTRAASEEAYGPGVTFHIGRISMVANTGTYLDSPYHRYAGGDDLAALPLERLVDLDGTVVRVGGTGTRPVDAAQLAPYEVAGLRPRRSRRSMTSRGRAGKRSARPIDPWAMAVARDRQTALAGQVVTLGSGNRRWGSAG